ncbi:MAG: tetratricopeptide repeat protein [Alphaproteobacteria bacterium]|nr:tetratricopeptide repeat protein [Alphaproteobacteria bacterium]MCB9672775.1 tetratricopeptide repeat protein [Alphaproteobacteria bacterium]
MILLFLACSTPTPDPARSAPIQARQAIASDVQAAHRLRMEGDRPGALAAYEAAITRDPDDLLARLAIGELLRSEGRWEDALPHLRRAAELAPQSPVPHEHLAVCLHELARHEEARAALDRAEALGSDQIGVLGPVIRR